MIWTRPSLAIVFAFTVGIGVGLPDDAVAQDSYLCSAQGIYETCSDAAGYRTCVDQTSTGMGQAATKAEARVAAELNCSQHMTNMIIIANMDGGGGQKVACAAVACEKATANAGTPAPDAGGDANAAPTNDGGFDPFAILDDESAPACERATEALCGMCGDGARVCVELRAALSTADAAECEAELPTLRDGFEQMLEIYQQDQAQGLAIMQEVCASGIEE